MSKYLLCTILAIIPLVGHPQQAQRTFHRTGFNNSATIELHHDSTFAMKSIAHSCVPLDGKRVTSIREVYGDYEVEGLKLRFHPRRQRVKGYRDETVEESRSPTREEGFFVFSYSLVEYATVTFLFADRDPERCSPLELRFHNSFVYVSQKLNEEGGEARPQPELWRSVQKLPPTFVFRRDIKAAFPAHYREFVLDATLDAEVLQTREVSFLNPQREANPDWQRYLITLGVGKEDGVKPSLCFFYKADGKDECRLEVTSVFRNSCEGYLADYFDQKGILSVKRFSTTRPAVDLDEDPPGWIR